MTSTLNFKLPALLITLILLAQSANAQSDELNKKRLHGVLIFTGVANAVTLVGLNQLWYSEHPRESFHFFDDWPEWKQMDKMGHAYSAFHLSNTYNHAYQWSGMNQRQANLWGSITGLLLITQIEIFDGFSSEYGASWSDFAFNTLGAASSFSQNHFWNEIRIHPKYSFRRSGLAGLRPELLGDGLHQEIIKDYNAQTFWLSFDINKLIPKSKFPAWINLAVGYGADDMIYGRDNVNQEAGFSPHRQYFLALDFDISHLRSEKKKWLNPLIYLVNMIHLPAPTIEFSQQEGWKFHWLY